MFATWVYLQNKADVEIEIVWVTWPKNSTCNCYFEIDNEKSQLVADQYHDSLRVLFFWRQLNGQKAKKDPLTGQILTNKQCDILTVKSIALRMQCLRLSIKILKSVFLWMKHTCQTALLPRLRRDGLKKWNAELRRFDATYCASLLKVQVDFLNLTKKKWNIFHNY